MSNFKIISELKDLYKRGENISNYLRKGNQNNTQESILISYDLQAGSYTRSIKLNKGEVFLEEYTLAIANIINNLGKFESILEIGVGEGNVLCPLMEKISNKKMRIHGFDLSWSRVRYAKKNIEEAKLDVNLFSANLFEIPLKDNSIDIVYTSHSIEPNGDREKEALKELYRICNKYIILLEPDYFHSSEKIKERMNKFGYIKNIHLHAKELDYEVIKHEKFPIYKREYNPTALTIIKKHHKNNKDLDINNISNFICPISKNDLITYGHFLYSKEGGLIYPIIQGIPSLLSDSAVLASHFHEFC